VRCGKVGLIQESPDSDLKFYGCDCREINTSSCPLPRLPNSLNQIWVLFSDTTGKPIRFGYLQLLNSLGQQAGLNTEVRLKPLSYKNENRVSDDEEVSLADPGTGN